jgi:hypothetical protein
LYRVPRSARSRAVRRLKIGVACLMALPTIGYNIYGILLWNAVDKPIERIMQSVTNNGLIGLLPTGIQLIGILASVGLVYATIRELQVWKIVLLIAFMIATLIFLGLYVYSFSVV